ncbi:MAG: hypothetical protein WD554_03050 [Flavobacteriaceae bacterium]
MKRKLTLILIIITYTSCISDIKKHPTTKIPENWEGLSDLQGKWIKIERDSKGYFLYQPCDGQTPSILISTDSLTLNHQVEEPTVLPIDRVSITKDSITINTNAEILTAEFIFKLVGPNADHIIFKWNYPKYKSRGKQAITRKELSKYLRNIENPCNTEKVPDHQFLPVEYD